MMAYCKLLASSGRAPDAPRQPGRQNAPFGRGTGGHTGDRVAAPIGGSARGYQAILVPLAAVSTPGYGPTDG